MAPSAVPPPLRALGPNEPRSAERAPELALAEPVVLWRFRSATSFSGAPAVSPTGRVYVVSVEGYLYALESDGTYRWSYVLSGMPVGAPAVDPAGHVYVATSEQRLYAFEPDGHLSWMQRVAARFASPPVWAAPGFIYYAGRDRNLYGVAAWGGVPEAHWLGSLANGTLAILADGSVAVGLETPEAQLFRRAAPLTRLELAAGSEHPLLGGKTHWYALTRAGLAAFDLSTRASVWTAPARRAGLDVDERALVLECDGELIWLEPASGQELHRVPLPDEPSASPVVTRAGIALVPLVSGGLLVVDPKVAGHARVPLGSAPTWPPVWSEPSRRVTAAAGGDVVGIDLSDWVKPLEREPVDAGESAGEPLDPRRGEVLPPARGEPRANGRSARGGA